MQQVFVYGSGGHGHVIADIIEAAAVMTFVGFVDDGGGTTLDHDRRRVIGDRSHLPQLLRSGVSRVIVGIGSNDQRAEKASFLVECGFTLVTAIHPFTWISPSALIGSGTVIMAGAVINAKAVIGESVIINTGASIDHDCVIGNAAHISPGVHLAGGVTIGNRTHVGIGAAVLPGMRIGSNAVVGAGAVVTLPVEDRTTVVGVPARVINRREGK